VGGTLTGLTGMREALVFVRHMMRDAVLPYDLMADVHLPFFLVLFLLFLL
jgi:hypothetical protein